MDHLQIITLMSVPTDTAEAFSALPHAPVQPESRRRPHAVGLRSALATGLRRTADAIAPTGARRAAGSAA